MSRIKQLVRRIVLWALEDDLEEFASEDSLKDAVMMLNEACRTRNTLLRGVVNRLEERNGGDQREGS